MKNLNSASILPGIALGVALTVGAATMMGQTAGRVSPADTQYFVTEDDGEAHLWLREGNALKMVSHGSCPECAKGHEGHDHEHAEGDGHDHGASGEAASDHSGHGHGEGGAIGTAPIGVWTVNVSGEIKAGSEAHLDIKLSGSTARPAAVRVWIGSQDGKGAMKQKADGNGTDFHAHADVPSTITADAKLWIEIDDGKGNKSVGGFAIKK